MNAKWLFKLCIWREARGESFEGQRAVAHVIWNRCKGQKDMIPAIVMKPWQFSSMTADGDTQLELYPQKGDVQYEVISKLVEEIEADPDNTGGADHYFNPHVVLPTWAKNMTKTCSIGNHDFYKA